MPKDRSAEIFTQMGLIVSGNFFDTELWEALWPALAKDKETTMAVNLKLYMCAI